MVVNSQQTLVSLLLNRLAQSGDKQGLAIKREGRFQWLTWNQIARDVRATAARLRTAGLNRGDRLILVSENRYEWILCDLATHLLGGVMVATHNSLAGPQIAYQINDSGANLVVVARDEQASKLAAAAELLPSGLRFLSFEPVERTI